MNLIFYLLLHLLHFLNNLYRSIKRYCIEIDFIFKHLVHSGKNKHSVDQLPKHVAILVGLEEISIIDMVKLIDWCSMTGIPYISFYDHKGTLKKNLPFFKKKLESLATEWLIDSNDHHIDKVKIQILSYLDGKNEIVSLTKQLCHKCNEDHEKDITPRLIGAKLNVPTPEPDLAIVFGRTMCSYGFLPWHTRITEFFVLPSHCGILLDDLTRILMKYSKCQQHYGK